MRASIRKISGEVALEHDQGGDEEGSIADRELLDGGRKKVPRAHYRRRNHNAEVGGGQHTKKDGTRITSLEQWIRSSNTKEVWFTAFNHVCFHAWCGPPTTSCPGIFTDWLCGDTYTR